MSSLYDIHIDSVFETENLSTQIDCHKCKEVYILSDPHRNSTKCIKDAQQFIKKHENKNHGKSIGI